MKVSSKIVKEIHAIEIKGDRTLQEMYDDFYAIMKKHGIYAWKKAGKDGKGYHGHSPEFVMCHAVFRQYMEGQITMMTLMGYSDLFAFDVPKAVYEGKK